MKGLDPAQASLWDRVSTGHEGSPSWEARERRCDLKAVARHVARKDPKELRAQVPARLQVAMDYCRAIAEARGRRPPHLYFVQSGGPHGLIKIGVTTNLTNRLGSIRTDNPFGVRVLGVVEHGGKELEARLHERFAADRTHGEWFHPSRELVAVIVSLCEEATP